MFLYGDIVKAPKHRYIVVSVDDSIPGEVRYGLVRATKTNMQLFNPGSYMPICPTYWYNANVLEYAGQL